MKKRHRETLIPTDFAPPAKILSNLPGSPENTNPINMRAAGREATPEIGGPSAYFDSNQKGAYPVAMGTAHLDPTQYLPSQMSNMPVGQKLNAGFNYGQQPQPSQNAFEPMEGMRLGGDAQRRGVMAHPFLGMTGSPTIIPGAMDPMIPGQGQGLMQETTASLDGQNNSKKGAKA